MPNLREPAVSVVVPTYNRSGAIRRAIDSALAQTFRDLEIVVIDDGSTDDTVHLLRRWYGDEGPVRYIWQPHRNAAAARNRGIRESRGRYIAFQDSDDEWLPEKLEKQVSILEGAAETTGLVYCDMLRVMPSGRVREFSAPGVRRGETFGPSTDDYQWRGIGVQATLFRRPCFAEGRLFDENLFALCDLELLLRLSQDFDFHHLREPLVKYYAGPGISTDMAAIASAREYMLVKHRERFVQQPRRLAYQHAKISAARVVSGDPKSAREHAVRAIGLDPANPRILVRSLPGLLGLRIPTGSYSRLRRILPASWEAR
jgi:glycosyltransferase involved in cell wall biosynthesis